MEGLIRSLALAVIRRGDGILVEQGRDETKGETFFRLLGDGIEFGEPGADRSLLHRLAWTDGVRDLLPWPVLDEE
ncbi:MAG TPA: hypothetical protein VFL61_11465 [Gaiellaceae bacterium]|nr:hypothetical protein [Gaiellaceae bacterium]